MSVVSLSKINPGAWHVPTMADWLSEAADSSRWLVPHLIPEDALVLVSGQQKRAFKTWFADLTALALSTGVGMTLMQPVRTVRVLYIQEEGTRAGSRERIMGLCRTLQISPTSLTNLFFAYRSRVKLDVDAWRQRIISFVRQHNIEFVILDALSYMHVGDENKTSEMAAVVDTLQSLRAARAGVMFLAHLDKGRGEQATADIDAQVRGSGIVVNCYDTHLALRRYDSHRTTIDLTVRQREAEEQRFTVAWDIVSENDTITRASLSMAHAREAPTDDTTFEIPIATPTPRKRGRPKKQQSG